MELTTLGAFLLRFEELSDREGLIHDSGLRIRRLTYADLLRLIAGFQKEIRNRGLQKGDRVLLWCENRPEWLAAFWGCVFSGVQLVPVDAQRSWEFVGRVQDQVGANLLVVGDRVDVPETDEPVFRARLVSEAPQDRVSVVSLDPDEVVQILFTSGTTGRPKGVVHTHSNLCSALQPIATEMRKYRKWVKWFQPIRLMTLLPLSHIFGQAFSLFVPALLEGSLVLVERVNPLATVKTIRRQKVSVVALVPAMLEALREEARHRFSLPDEIPELGRGLSGALLRWIRYGSVHRWLGLKFWSFVVGGARVPLELEAFWANLGFAVIQGYGLTEAGSLVSLNHPLEPSRGSIGKALPGVEIRLAEDGEILVRGPGVSDTAAGRDSEGWLHTGDIGELDEQANIYYRGRKKDVIVGSGGLNVFPEDVEEVLLQESGVEDAVVLPKPVEGGEEVHACLILEDGVDASELIDRVNRKLEDYQRIRSHLGWPEEDFPRTESTFKIRRQEMAARLWGEEALEKEEAAEKAEPTSRVERALDRLSDAHSDSETGEDLDLSSLERLELLGRLEDRYTLHLSESQFSEARSLSKIRQLMTQARSAQAAETVDRDQPPRWPQRTVFRWFRAAFQELFFLPLLRQLVTVSVTGLKPLEELDPPCIFAANHSSHLDTPVILKALPRRWRRRVAPAMGREHFAPHFDPDSPLLRRWEARVKYYLALALFGTYPLSGRRGTRSSLEFTGQLIEKGRCPLIYPEGIRSRDLESFQPGVGLIAIRLGIPVVPVRIRGTFEVHPPDERWPQKRGQIRVAFGKPLDLREARNPEEAAERIEQAVRELL